MGIMIPMANVLVWLEEPSGHPFRLRVTGTVEVVAASSMAKVDQEE